MKKNVLITLAFLLIGCTVFALGSKDNSADAEWQDKGTPLADVRVRQALLHAIDMDTIIATIFEGQAQKAISLSSPGSWLASGLTEYKYDPALAKNLLSEAGWPSSYTLDVVYYYDDQQTVDLMSVIQQYWSDVGVKAQFRRLEGDLASQLWVPPADRVNGPSDVKWDLAYAAIAALVEHEFYDRFSSTAANNSTLPYQEGLDELILATNATADVETQQEAFYALQREMNENLYQLPLYHQLTFVYVGDSLDIAGSELGNDQFAYEKNILDWKTTRSDKTLYTNGGALEFFETPFVNPAMFLYQEVIFDRLINADASLTPTDGLLAKSYTTSADGKTISFVVRNDVTWHDGVPFTAEDVKFTYEYMAKVPGLNSVADTMMNDVESITVNGDTVTFQFKNLSPNAMTVFSQWAILPKHLLENSNPVAAQQDQFWQKPVGTGPFKFEAMVRNNYTVLARNENYFQSGNGNIEKIYMFASGENDGNLIKNIESGSIDYAWSKSTDDAKAVGNLNFMSVNPVNIRYTRLFFVNQYPHEANIK
ncbi:MAG: ABC transporter substrate-binding protein [Spirochaetales bacterium]